MPLEIIQVVVRELTCYALWPFHWSCGYIISQLPDCYNFTSKLTSSSWQPLLRATEARDCFCLSSVYSFSFDDDDFVFEHEILNSCIALEILRRFGTILKKPAAILPSPPFLQLRKDLWRWSLLSEVIW